MFHTFEGLGSPEASTSVRGRNNERQQSTGRRVMTLRACTSCRHRKIKCDGEKPCEACRWYKKADCCHYSDPRPSRRHVEKLSTEIEEYRSVLEKLFPGTAPDSLVSLSRERLFELIGRSLPQSKSQKENASSPASSPYIEGQILPIPNEDGMESLQSIPEEINTRNSEITGITSGVSDDVNALSLSTGQPSSYLGVSSIHAALKVIFWLDPGSLSTHSSSSKDGEWYSTNGNNQADVSPLAQSQLSEIQLIDAYFTCVQPFVPMLDEKSFRETHHSGQRKDDRWLGLLNIILALGSIAACTSNDTSHQMFFQRSKRHLGLETLGCSHLETIQTLGLIGGYYLHYTSQPNLAYSLMGAALRMAAALGLHKEFSDHDRPNRQKIASIDIRRRVWWSLFCMDTWGNMTLGRPSMGRIGATITVKLPHYRETGNVLEILPLLENVRFCRIATQIQEVLAVAPLTKHCEISQLDNQLLEWYGNLPSILKDHKPCSESISITRTVMRWRYSNQRLLLYRPTLLSYAMRRVPYIVLRYEERTAIEKCREIAEATIHDISATVCLSQMSGWNAVWLIFQAVMIPLLGLFLNDNSVDDIRATVESCQAQVEMAMLVLARMQPWSPTANQTLDVVSRIFEASKQGHDVTSEASSATSSYGSNENDISLITPPILPSQPESRCIVANNGVTELSIPQFIDENMRQSLWDYLSWSDNIWPGLSDIETIDATLLGNGEKAMEYLGSNEPFFDLPDAALLMSQSVSLY